jgi:hypothetical protein
VVRDTLFRRAPVAQRKSIGLLIRRSGVRILPGAYRNEVRSASRNMTTSFGQGYPDVTTVAVAQSVEPLVVVQVVVGSSPIRHLERPSRAPFGAGGGLFPAHSAASLRAAATTRDSSPAGFVAGDSVRSRRHGIGR